MSTQANKRDIEPADMTELVEAAYELLATARIAQWMDPDFWKDGLCERMADALAKIGVETPTKEEMKERITARLLSPLPETPGGQAG